MSVIQVGDIAKGIELCIWIHDNCFTRINRADVRYRQFRDDVAKLKPILIRFRAAFERSLLHRGADASDTELLRYEAKELVGDFNATLEDCRDFLANSKDIVKDGSGFIDNVIWGVSTKKRVDDLRARLQLDIQRIEFFLEAVKLEQSSSQTGDIQDILINTRQLLGASTYSAVDPIPAWLDARFRSALQTNAPVSFASAEDIPLEDGHEALYRHYQASISGSSSDQSMDQYLHLLKAQWILETIKGSGSFKALRPGSFYIRTVTRLDYLITEQLAWSELVKFADTDLQKLNDSAFLIWPPRKTSQLKQLTEPKGFEEEILMVPVPESSYVRKEDLVIFQRGPTTLRLARNVIPINGAARQESEKLNTHVDRFIPLYAVPPSRSGRPSLTFKVSDAKDGSGTPYEFKCEKDLFAFQRAITGYDVMSDISKVTWTLNEKILKVTSKSFGSYGRVQLWHWDPWSSARSLHMGSSGGESDYATSQSQDSSSSRRSDLTSPSIANVLKGETKSLFAVTESDDGETVLAVAPQPAPVLIIFSKEGGEYSMVQIELRPGLGIQTSSCHCRKSETKCKRTVLENIRDDTPTNFQVNHLRGPLDLWDVAVFGLPTHPALKKAKHIERLKCDFLNLDFESVQERRRFNTHLRALFKLRDTANASYNRTRKNALFLSDRVSSSGSSHRTITAMSCRDSMSTVSRTDSMATISPRDSMATISHRDSMASGSRGESTVTVSHRSSMASMRRRESVLSTESDPPRRLGRLSRLLPANISRVSLSPNFTESIEEAMELDQPGPSRRRSRRRSSRSASRENAERR